MSYFIPIPIVLIAVIIYLVAVETKLKLFQTICKIVILLGVLYFIYAYAAHNGYDIINMITTCLGYIKDLLF